MLKNMKIGSRIILALTLPVLGVLFFSGYSIYEKDRVSSDMAALQQLAELAPTISGVVHELQKERGTSAVYIGSKGKKFADQLPTQHNDTNTALDALDADLTTFDAGAYGDVLKMNLDSAVAALGELNDKRGGVKSLNLTVPQMAKYYTGTIAKLLSIVEEMAIISNNASVTNTIKAYTSFLQAKERAGQERAMGGAGFGAGKFAPGIYRRLIELIAEQNVLLSTFDIYASDTQRTALKDIVQGADVDEVNRMRKIAVDSQYSNTVEGIEGPYWFKTITSKINKLKQVEDVIAHELGMQAGQIKQVASQSFYVFLIATGALLTVTASFVFVIVTGITRPVLGLAETMEALADGDTSVEVNGTERGDEIGEMAAAVQVFKDSAIEVKRLEGEQQANKERAEKEKHEFMLKIADDFEGSVGGVVHSVSSASTEMHSSATALSETVDQTAQQSTAASAAAEEASTNVQTVASAAEELTSAISEISRQVSQSTEIASAAVSEVDGVNEKVQGLADAAQKIGEVVALITDIADQTNLLALNATIEAARAGEAGKGFAVVASEVKNLANQTAKATEEISNQIGDIQGATQDAVSAIGAIGGIISQMSEISSAIAAAVEEQGAATQEIARNVEQASNGTITVSSNIAQVNQGTEETGQSAEQMMAAAGELSEQSETLRREVDEFLSQIRNG